MFGLSKVYIYLIVAALSVGLIGGTYLYGVHTGKQKAAAKYETAANKALKKAEETHLKQIEEKNAKIKVLNDKLNKQITIVRSASDECLDKTVPDDIVELLNADSVRN